MPVVARKPESNFVPAPEGTHQAVCVDVWPVWRAVSEYNGVRKQYEATRIVWLLSELQDDGRPFMVSKMYRNSLHEHAAMRKDLEVWRGKVFTEKELSGFVVDDLIGANCLLTIVHKVSGEITYANVASIAKTMKGMEKLPVPSDYVREENRDDFQERQAKREERARQMGGGDDDVHAVTATEEASVEEEALPF